MKRLKDELKLFNRLRKGDESARGEIFKAHQAMVAKVAWHYHGKSKLSVEELIAEGYVGLLQAVEKFNPAKARRRKAKFSSYAYWWIRRYILRAVIKEQSILSVPESVSELLHKYNHFAGILTQALGREPTETEVKKILALSEQQMERVSRRRAVRELSLDDRSGVDEENRSLAEVIGAGVKDDIEEDLEREALLEKFFTSLTALEKEVVTYRFGLKNTPQLTYKEIGEKMKERLNKNLSRQRIHQIFRAALEKIRAVREEEKKR